MKGSLNLSTYGCTVGDGDSSKINVYYQLGSQSVKMLRIMIVIDNNYWSRIRMPRNVEYLHNFK